MAPEAAEPLHVGLHAGIAGQKAQGLEDVVPAHLLEAPEQGAGVIEHDPRIAALTDQLGDQLRHAPVALGKGLSVVVVALPRVLEHVLQVGDQLAAGAGRNRGLVHVQGTGEAGADPFQLQGVGRRNHRALPLHQGQEFGFAAGDRRQTLGVHRCGRGWHRPYGPPARGMRRRR
jgi:hypothetical protein